MNDQFAEIRDHFLAALERDGLDAQLQYAAQLCGHSPELRAGLEAMLRAHHQTGGFLASRADMTQDSPVKAEAPGTLVGPYKLLQEIGQGGMGVVYMAEQLEPVRRKVALKIIKPGMDTRQVIARFEAERQALSLMDHPNIARVLDVGATASGRPYFVMELVKGQAITQYCDEKHLTPRQRLELLLPVCQAIQHAHQKGIIHRDIKPSNILVAEYDQKPVPKVIDFGVAKAISQPLTEKTMFTGYGQIVGTLEYMSPEQAKVNQLDIDTRSDIYSLGVLMYELLTGVTPFDKQRLRSVAWDEVLRIIREEEPPKPSTRLSESKDSLPSVSALRQTEPARLTKLVRGELDWIVMRALEKDRDRRYETANGLAMDIQRYLADEPVQACPPSVRYRLRKVARRNKALISTIGMVSTALIIGIVVSVWQAIRATDAERGMAKERDAASLAEGRASESAKNAEIQRGIAVQNEKIAKENELMAKRRYYAAQMNLAVRAWEEEDTPRVLELLETQRPRRGEDDLRAFEWYALWQLCHQQLHFSRQAFANANYMLAFSPDSSLIALGSSDGTVTLIDAVEGQEVRTLQGHGRSRYGTIAFSPDGKLLAQAVGAGDDDIVLWNVRTGEQSRVFGGSGKVNVLVFSPDGKTLATSTGELAVCSVCLWDMTTGILQQTWKTHNVRALEFSPDGNELATSSDWGTGQDATLFWDLTASPPKVVRQVPERGRAVAFSPDGKHFAVSRPYAFELFDTQTWKALPFARGAWSGRCLAFVPGRNALAVGVATRSVKVIDIDTGQVNTLAHHASVESLAVAPNGNLIAAIGSDGVLKVWNVDREAKRNAVDVGGYIHGLSLSPDGQTLAVGEDQTVKTFNVQTGEPKSELSGHSQRVGALAFFRAGTRLAAGSANWGTPGELKVWNLLTAKEAAQSPEFNAAVLAISISPDEKSLVVGGPQGDLAVFDVASGERRSLVKAPGLTSLTHSPDGKFLISGAGANRITLRDPTTGAERLSFGPKETTGFASSLSCSPDGELLATGHGGRIHLWQLPSARLRTTLPGGTSSVRSLAFFPDSKTLASSNDSGEVKLWDVATGQERITFRLGHALALSRDGQMLATGSSGKVWLLRAATSPEAMARKSELDRDDPESPLAELDGGDRLWASGEKQEAELAYRKANERLRTLAQQFPQEVGYSREVVRSTLSLYLLLIDQGNVDEAERSHKEAQTHSQNLPHNEQRVLARHFFTIGQMLQTQGRTDAAFRAYAQAIELSPQDSTFWFERAYAYGTLGESVKAIADYQKVVELDPKNAAAWNNLGVANERLGKEDDALTYFTKAAALPSAGVLCWRNRARLYAKRLQWEQAVADYQKIVDLSPSDAQGHNDLSWLLANCPMEELRNPQRAVALSAKAVGLAPKDGTIWNTLGVAHYRAGNWQDGLAALEKSIDLRKGGDAFDWFFLAMAHWQLGNRDQARKWYDQAVQWMDQHAKENEELVRFRSEAETLLEIEKK